MRQQSKKTRRQVFEACSRILRDEGLANLTLEAVAEEAQLSKGGLLYHFPNKEALVEDLFEYHNNIFEARLAKLAEDEGKEAGAWLRAYAKASLEQIADPENASLYASLFAAEERYAGAHQLMRSKYVNWQQQVEKSGIDPALGTLVRLAVDGLWFAEMHRYAPPDLVRRREILEMILNMTFSSAPPKH